MTYFGPSMRDVRGQVRLDYPNGRPRYFEITTDLFEAMVKEINDCRRDHLATSVERSATHISQGDTQ